MDDTDSSSDNEFIKRLGLKLKTSFKKKRPAPCMDENELNTSRDIENIDISNLQCVEQVGDVLYPIPALEPQLDMTISIDNTSTSTYQLTLMTTGEQNVTVTKEPTINTHEAITPLPSVSIQTSPTAGPSSAPKITILSDVTFYGNLKDTKLRKNKALMDSRNWKKNINQEKRMKGENYLGYRRDRKAKNQEKFKVIQDVFRPARLMQPTCKSNYCIKSKLRGCDNITEVSRQGLFDSFWKKMNWEQRRTYICSHVISLKKKVTKSAESKRSESRAYFFTINNHRIQVCKKMFLQTLGIKDWFVRYWREKTDCAMPPHCCVSTEEKRINKKADPHQHLDQYLDNIPKMPSHYCRATTSREYLEPLFESKTQLYKEYKRKSEFDGVEYLSRKTFEMVFLKKNLSLFRPKNDQCDLCCSHKTGNISEEHYTQHIAKKDRARSEKQCDKTKAESGNIHVFTQDLQSVKLAPYLKASAIYYKMKLCVHNFTLYNLATKEVVCFWFDETNCSLEASVFASCLIDQLRKLLTENCIPVVLYSDGCCAQNRNSILSSALLRLAIAFKTMITQKYLEKGHTQMECDSVHSAIECKLKGKEIYLPEQYSNICTTARPSKPYKSLLLDFSFFTDFTKDLIYKSIRPGRKPHDPVVTDIRMLEHRPDGTIWYKLNFDDHIKPVPQRSTPLNKIKRIEELPKLYISRLPITKRKFDDLCFVLVNPPISRYLVNDKSLPTAFFK